MIKYKELSWPLRIGILSGWLVFLIYAFMILLVVAGFIMGFISG